MPKTMQNIAAALSTAPMIRFSPNKPTPASSSTKAAKIQKNRSIVATDNAPAEDCSYHFVERFTIARCSFRSRRTRRGRCPSSVKVLKARSSISRVIGIADPCDVPAVSDEARGDITAISQRRVALDGDVVVVADPTHDDSLTAILATSAASSPSRSETSLRASIFFVRGGLLPEAPPQENPISENHLEKRSHFHPRDTAEAKP